MIETKTFLVGALLNLKEAEGINKPENPSDIVEFFCRKSVSQLYYGSFHVARDYALEIDANLQPNVSHTDLWNWFRTNPKARQLKIGRVHTRGIRFHESRKYCDYDIHKEFNCTSRMNDALDDFKGIVGLLNQPLLDEVSEIVNEIVVPKQK